MERLCLVKAYAGSGNSICLAGNTLRSESAYAPLLDHEDGAFILLFGRRFSSTGHPAAIHSSNNFFCRAIFTSTRARKV